MFSSQEADVTPGVNIPTKILQNDMLSSDPTGKYAGSEAAFCFTQQAFSANLQTFMISYVMSISGLYPVYS